MEYRLRRADGRYRWIHDCATPRIAPDGSCIGYIGAAVDITDQKIARLMLSDFNHKLLEAQESERARIARELHENVSQRVAGLAMLVHTVTHRLGDNGDWARTNLDQVCMQLAAVTRSLSTMSHQLYPSIIEILGLSKAADAYCRERADEHDVRILFAHDPVLPDLPNTVALGVFRVLQEALENAVKHSNGRCISVSLRGSQEHIELEVADDGIGFLPDAIRFTKGLGLMSMQERVRLMNGDLVIESKPGSGTSLKAFVRLSAQGASIAS